MIAGEVKDYSDDFDDFDGDPDDLRCHYCRGEGWGIIGCDWDSDDPVNEFPGEIQRCPCCYGSGKADDCTFW
jgi:hypothetical protein